MYRLSETCGDFNQFILTYYLSVSTHYKMKYRLCPAVTGSAVPGFFIGIMKLPELFAPYLLLDFLRRHTVLQVLLPA